MTVSCIICYGYAGNHCWRLKTLPFKSYRRCFSVNVLEGQHCAARNLFRVTLSVFWTELCLSWLTKVTRERAWDGIWCLDAYLASIISRKGQLLRAVRLSAMSMLGFDGDWRSLSSVVWETRGVVCTQMLYQRQSLSALDHTWLLPLQRRIHACSLIAEEEEGGWGLNPVELACGPSWPDGAFDQLGQYASSWVTVG